MPQQSTLGPEPAFGAVAQLIDLWSPREQKDAPTRGGSNGMEKRAIRGRRKSQGLQLQPATAPSTKAETHQGYGEAGGLTWIEGNIKYMKC